MDAITQGSIETVVAGVTDSPGAARVIALILTVVAILVLIGLIVKRRVVHS